ncbi:hypothetical protein PVK62_17470 [Aliivibrio sp. S3MY1]|uniref:hypothetical protein n=1 Tax=unclassified Aliivibrio TaxID=2645654 RepID=UPI00237874CA|nr:MULTISPECIES: hypothetical protein [unclassified Aliivibrio]MDD9197608.1 hypothetical protein [Aliivibrio sp. S3MY1]MDD9200859.1 hypothetical protein [Aliivibrio sp. S2MY1]
MLESLLKYAPLISAIMPLVVIIMTGIWVNTRLEKVKSRFQLDHSIIEKRATIYASIQEDFNKIYSYIRRVGDWKELTPNDILESKRKIDRIFHSTKPYWSKESFKAYEQFMSVCFKAYRGHGKDAGIIAKVERYQSLSNWESIFSECFESGYDKDKLVQVNKELMESLSKDFGVE